MTSGVEVAAGLVVRLSGRAPLSRDGEYDVCVMIGDVKMCALGGEIKGRRPPNIWRGSSFMKLCMVKLLRSMNFLISDSALVACLL